MRVEINNLGERIYTVFDQYGRIIIRTTNVKVAEVAQQWQKI
jgi:hypothetical protein